MMLDMDYYFIYDFGVRLIQWVWIGFKVDDVNFVVLIFLGIWCLDVGSVYIYQDIVDMVVGLFCMRIIIELLCGNLNLFDDVVDYI